MQLLFQTKLRQTSSGGGYRPSRSLCRPCSRASVLRRSMSSAAVRSSTDGRRASGEEFFRSKILEAQLPRGVSSRLTDRLFASSCNAGEREREVRSCFVFSSKDVIFKCSLQMFWKDKKSNMLQDLLSYYHIIWLIRTMYNGWWIRFIHLCITHSSYDELAKQKTGHTDFPIIMRIRFHWPAVIFISLSLY